MQHIILKKNDFGKSLQVKEVKKTEEFRGPPVPELTRPPSRLSRKAPGQLQL